MNPDDRTGQDRLGQDRTKLIHGGGSAQLSSVQLSLGVMLAELGSQRVEGHSQEDAGLSLLVPGGRPCVGAHGHVMQLRSLALLLVSLGVHHAVQVFVVLLPAEGVLVIGGEILGIVVDNLLVEITDHRLGSRGGGLVVLTRVHVDREIVS
mgnify:CR=1